MERYFVDRPQIFTMLALFALRLAAVPAILGVIWSSSGLAMGYR